MFSLHVILFERKDYFTDVFVELWEKLTDGTSDHIDMLENFMLQLNGLRHDTLFAARLEKFKKSTESDLCLLPPSKEALRQHIYRASYQAGYLWRQSAEELDIPDPGQWGWKKPLREISNLYGRLVSLLSRLRIPLKLAHLRLVMCTSQCCMPIHLWMR